MKILVLFAGTGSIEKVYDREQHDIRGVDIDNHFRPYYNVDILTWDYKEVFKNWVPDYIHGSPVCKEFSNLKSYQDRDMELGLSLLNKCLEIIEYVKTINPKLKYTIENPKGLMRKLECMDKYKRITTTYCMYGYMYQKPTDFWYGGFELELRPCCRRTKNIKNWCDSMKSNNGVHKVRIGFGKGKYKGEGQIGDCDWFKELRKLPQYQDSKYTDTYFRYRIPEDLCKDIMKCVLKE